MFFLSFGLAKTAWGVRVQGVVVGGSVRDPAWRRQPEARGKGYLSNADVWL